MVLSAKFNYNKELQTIIALYGGAWPLLIDNWWDNMTVPTMPSAINIQHLVCGIQQCEPVEFMSMDKRI